MTTTQQAIDLPFDEAIAYLRQKTSTTSTGWTDVWQRANAHAFTVAGAGTDALVADFRAEVTKALEQGTTLAEFRAGFDDIVKRHGWSYHGTPGWRSRIIYETNLSMAYSAGRYAQQTEPETLAAFPYWQYVHSGAAHPRKQHLAWNGLTLRADDPFWDTHYPPNGWRCGCRVRPLSERGLERQGKSGPDQAPPMVTRPWTDPRTGQTHDVPVGIDPSFDYNPGQAWKNDSTTPPTPIARPDEIRDFVQASLAGEVRDKSRSVVAAHLPDDLAKALGGSRREIEINAFRPVKVAGRAEELGGKPSHAHLETTPDDWARIATMVRDGAVYLDPAHLGRYRQLTILWDDPDAAEPRKLMLVVRRAFRPDGGERLTVPTLRRTGRDREKRIRRTMKKVRDGV